VKARLEKWWSTQDVHSLDLLRGVVIAGVLKILAAVLAFGLSVVVGRILGAEGAGIYFLALTTATVAATVGRFGLDSAVLRSVAARASAGQWPEVGAVQEAAVRIGSLGSLLIGGTLFLGSDFLADRVFSDPAVAEPMRLMALAVVPLSLSVLTSRSLLGLALVRASLLVFSIIPGVVALGGTWILAARWGVNGAVVAYVFAVTVALAYGWLAWQRASAGRMCRRDRRQANSVARDLLKSGSPLLIGALLQLVMQMSGTLMLGAWSDSAEVGRFAVAWRTALLISFVLVAVNTIAQPKFAELYARSEMDTLAVIANKATILMTGFAAPVLLLFLVAPEVILSAFGDGFVEAAVPLQILAVGQFINVAAGSVGVLLVMSSKEREYRNVQVVAAAVVLCLNIVLIPSQGAIGAAVAASAGLIVQNVLFGYFVWAKLGIVTVGFGGAAHRKGGRP